MKTREQIEKEYGAMTYPPKVLYVPIKREERADDSYLAYPTETTAIDKLRVAGTYYAGVATYKLVE